jgi:hypothetical protein
MTPPPATGKRPMASVRRISLFRREIRESISPSALDALLASAGRISEGALASDGRYYGSTMLTVDLEQAARTIRERCDVATAVRLAEHMDSDPEVARIAAQLGLEEAMTLARRQLSLVDVDIRIRRDGLVVCVDVDVEAVPANGAVASEREG